MSEKRRDKKVDELHHTLAEVRLGVWRVVYSHGSALSIPGKQTIEEWKRGYRYIQTYIVPFFLDVWRVLGTKLFCLYLLNHFWWGIEGALLLYLLSGLLKQIEAAYVNGNPDKWAIGGALSVRLFFVALVALIRWIHDAFAPAMRTKTKLHFQKMVMQTHLRLDLPTYSEAANRPEIQATQTWYVFTEIMGVVNVAFSALSHLAFIADLARGEQGGLFFAMLCVAKPVFTSSFTRNLWSTNFILYAINPNYLRSVALNSLATEKQYKQDVLSGSLENYIENEFQKTQVALGETPDEFPSQMFAANPSPLPDILTGLLGDLPLVYYALSSIVSPGRLSISSLAMFQQTASSLRDTFERITRQKSSLSENLHHVESLYNGIKIENTIPDGKLPYPAPEEKESSSGKKGMAISVRNVSFQYPGSSETRVALKDISFDLPASSLVVIVGANGSGKSSLVKLLSILHHPTSGTILIDGKPSSEYRSQDLRKATALLTQDHLLFPFSVAENIAIGDPDCEDTPEKQERVRAAAKMGGATEVIGKLDNGLEEMTRRAESAYCSQYPMPPGPLKDIVDKVEKYTDFSGGETQRLVASRTFMRISSGKIKLVVADEPTSAMDPGGEFELFQALRKVREGTTMIFITHRFGHLTKHADLILCLKDGELVESGTHRELVAKEGEYHKLYNIQASAFAEDPIPISTTPSDNGDIPNGHAKS